MGMLDYLQQKEQTIKQLSHPFVHSSELFRKTYCFGIGILCLGHMNAIEELESFFYLLLSKLGLPASCRDLIIPDINHNLDYRMDTVLQTLDTKEKQYGFVIDLYLASHHARLSLPYCQEIILGFEQAFHFSGKERDFFSFFMDCARNAQPENAQTSYQLFAKEGHVIPYNLLKYAFPALDLLESYEGLFLTHGEHFIIDKNCQIHGDITISNGSSLTLLDASITMDGAITIKNGFLDILRTEIHVTDCHKDFFLTCLNSAGLCANQLLLHGNGNSGLLSMNEGSLSLQDCTFMDSSRQPALSFSGHTLTVSDCLFQNCQKGGIVLSGRSNANISQSAFQDCVSDYGGAISADSLCDITITRNHFLNCHARYLGSCIYFKHKKYGQKASNNTLFCCQPEAAAIFNAWPADNNTISRIPVKERREPWN